jgi:hypothetical protein
MFSASFGEEKEKPTMQKKFGIAVVTALPTTNTPGGFKSSIERGVSLPTANA